MKNTLHINIYIYTGIYKTNLVKHRLFFVIRNDIVDQNKSMNE